jgi:hypothetical protein
MLFSWQISSLPIAKKRKISIVMCHFLSIHTIYGLGKLSSFFKALIFLYSLVTENGQTTVMPIAIEIARLQRTYCNRVQRSMVKSLLRIQRKRLVDSIIQHVPDRFLPGLDGHEMFLPETVER